MQNRSVWFDRGSARVSRANASLARTFGVAPKQSFLNARILISGNHRKVRDRETRSPAPETDALPDRACCAIRARARSFALRRKPRRLLRRLKRKWSQSSFPRHVSIFHSINRPQL